MHTARATLHIAAAAVTASGLLTSCQPMPSSHEASGAGLEFSVVGQAESAAERPPTIERASSAALDLSGAIATPNPCYSIDARLAEDGRTLTLTLSANATGGICVQMLAAFQYSARITGLKPGHYTVVMVYDYPGSGWEQRQHRLQVEVR